MKNESISLFFSEGSSNKEYHAELKEVGDNLYVVNIAYGRRGAALTAGTKTASPVPYEKAKKAYDKVVKEKIGKGYTPDESGSPYQGSQNLSGQKVASGLKPQLLNQITETEALNLINNNSHCGQEKKDGVRLMVRKTSSGEVIGSNKLGIVIALPLSVANAFKNVESCEVDGELVAEHFFMFDMLQNASGDIRTLSYKERYEALLAAFSHIEESNISIVATAWTPSQKQAMFNSLKEAGKEGMVFKLITGEHKPGRPASGGDQLKFKFYETASVLVTKINDKRSVGMSIIMADGSQRNVGNVTIPPNADIPAIGQIIEVRYLYAYPNGALFQATYLGIREDVEPAECVESQLKFKAA